MVAGRIERYVERMRRGLHDAFAEDHPPEESARSFAIGAFITMLPTLGTGLLLFVAIAYVFDNVSKLALLASVVVFNPVVKWGVYVASFSLGVLLLGPLEGAAVADISLSAGPQIVVRLLVGNLILAAVAAAGSYVVVHRLAVRYAASDVAATVDEALEEVAEAVLEP